MKDLAEDNVYRIYKIYNDTVRHNHLFYQHDFVVSILICAP